MKILQSKHLRGVSRFIDDNVRKNKKSAERINWLAGAPSDNESSFLFTQHIVEMAAIDILSLTMIDYKKLLINTSIPYNILFILYPWSKECLLLWKLSAESSKMAGLVSSSLSHQVMVTESTNQRGDARRKIRNNPSIAELMKSVVETNSGLIVFKVIILWLWKYSGFQLKWGKQNIQYRTKKTAEMSKKVREISVTVCKS